MNRLLNGVAHALLFLSLPAAVVADQFVIKLDAPLTGEDYLHNLVEQLGRLFEAETTFIAHRVSPDDTKVRGIAAWKDGAKKDTWDFDLVGNPCHLVYDGQPVFLPCNVASAAWRAPVSAARSAPKAASAIWRAVSSASSAADGSSPRPPAR